MNRKDRIKVAEKFLTYLNSINGPTSISAASEALKIHRNTIVYIHSKLKKAGMVRTNSHGTEKNGIEYTREDIFNALGYCAKINYICEGCGLDKTKYKTLNDKNKIVYLDALGLKSSGNTCPDCVTKGWHKSVPRKAVELSHRKCRQCGEALPKSRYFNCYDCVLDYPTVDDSMIYDAMGDLSSEMEYETYGNYQRKASE